MVAFIFQTASVALKRRLRQRCVSRRSPEHESSNAGYHRPKRLRYSGSSVQVLIVCGRITLAESDQIEFKYRSNICKDFTQMGVEILHSENYEFWSSGPEAGGRVGERMSVNEIAFTWSPIAKAGSIARLFVSLGRRCMAHMVFLSAPQRRKDTVNGVFIGCYRAVLSLFCSFQE